MSQSYKEPAWEDLDKSKFYGLSAAFYIGVRLVTHPMIVVKTQRQVFASSKATVLNTVRAEGVKGVYRGFMVQTAGAMPSQVIYISVLEYLRGFLRPRLEISAEELGMSQVAACTLSDFIAGGSASLLSQLILVPVDVISQLQMTRPHGSGREIAREIIREYGFGRLYSGFSLSIMTSIPTSAVWWSVYGTLKRTLSHMYPSLQSQLGLKEVIHPEQYVPIQAFSGVCAGATAACATNPLDVIKTRYQVMHNMAESKNVSLKEMVENLWRKEGARGFFRGVRQRALQMSQGSLLLTLSYETVRKISVINPTAV
eukprot:Rmarinus@m.4653